MIFINTTKRHEINKNPPFVYHGRSITAITTTAAATTLTALRTTIRLDLIEMENPANSSGSSRSGGFMCKPQLPAANGDYVVAPLS